MSEFKVEAGIEIPPDVGKRGRTRYPWDQMKTGDSFFVPDDGSSNLIRLAGIGNQRAKIQDNGQHFVSCHITDEKLGKGVRVWRTA